MAKILCVLYPDPVTGYPPVYARDSLPVIDSYPDGQSLPTPSAIDSHPVSCWVAYRVNSAAPLSGGARP